jgi:hypothetical protein
MKKNFQDNAYREEGDELIKMIHDLLLKNNMNQAEIARQTGKSEEQISFILDPMHPSQWSLTDLPVLIRLLDGKAIARIICSWIGQLNIDIPRGSNQHGHIISEIAQLLTVISTSINNENISVQEARAIKNKLLDVIGAVESVIGRQFFKL